MHAATSVFFRLTLQGYQIKLVLHWCTWSYLDAVFGAMRSARVLTAAGTRSECAHLRFLQTVEWRVAIESDCFLYPPFHIWQPSESELDCGADHRNSHTVCIRRAAPGRVSSVYSSAIYICAKVKLGHRCIGIITNIK